MARKGKGAEDRAVNYLETSGHHVVTRNYICPRGEIDVITFDEDYLVFIEVKYRRKASYVSPEEAVTREKKERIVRCARRWLAVNDYKGNTRFDVIAISDDELRHYEDAFQVEN